MYVLLTHSNSLHQVLFILLQLFGIYGKHFFANNMHMLVNNNCLFLYHKYLFSIDVVHYKLSFDISDTHIKIVVMLNNSLIGYVALKTFMN